MSFISLQGENPMSRARLMAVAGMGLMMATTLPLPAQGDRVQGTLTAGTTKVTLASGMAVAYKSPSGSFISVVLSDKPVDVNAFAEDTRIGAGETLVPGLFEGAWKSQHIGKKLSGVTFTIGPSGLITDEFLVGGRNNTFGINSDNYLLDVKSRSPRLVGTIKTKQHVIDLGGGRSAGLDASFDLSLTTR
jgi:hypothetical protein